MPLKISYMPRLQTFVLLLKIMFLSYSELFQSAVRNLSQPFIYLTSLKNYTAGIKTYQKVLCRSLVIAQIIICGYSGSRSMQK